MEPLPMQDIMMEWS